MLYPTNLRSSLETDSIKVADYIVVSESPPDFDLLKVSDRVVLLRPISSLAGDKNSAVKALLAI